MGSEVEIPIPAEPGEKGGIGADVKRAVGRERGENQDLHLGAKYPICVFRKREERGGSALFQRERGEITRAAHSRTMEALKKEKKEGDPAHHFTSNFGKKGCRSVKYTVVIARGKKGGGGKNRETESFRFGESGGGKKGKEKMCARRIAPLGRFDRRKKSPRELFQRRNEREKKGGVKHAGPTVTASGSQQTKEEKGVAGFPRIKVNLGISS